MFPILQKVCPSHIFPSCLFSVHRETLQGCFYRGKNASRHPLYNLVTFRGFFCCVLPPNLSIRETFSNFVPPRVFLNVEHSELFAQKFMIDLNIKRKLGMSKEGARDGDKKIICREKKHKEKEEHGRA